MVVEVVDVVDVVDEMEGSVQLKMLNGPIERPVKGETGA